MIIKINNNNKVISRMSGKICENVEVDNIKSFEVDDIPSVSKGEALFFNTETKEFYTEVNPVARTLTEEERKAIHEATQSKENALRWLADNDWKPNKIIRREWTEDDPRWLEYLDKSLAMRIIIDRSNAIIRGEENE